MLAIRVSICDLRNIEGNNSREQNLKTKDYEMKTVQIQDRYNENETVGIRVEAIELDEYSQSQYKETHYAVINANQIAKLNRELSNGPKNVNVTKVDRLTGKGTEAQVYFSL